MQPDAASLGGLHQVTVAIEPRIDDHDFPDADVVKVTVATQEDCEAGRQVSVKIHGTGLRDDSANFEPTS